MVADQKDKPVPLAFGREEAALQTVRPVARPVERISFSKQTSVVTPTVTTVDKLKVSSKSHVVDVKGTVVPPPASSRKITTPRYFIGVLR